MNYPLFLRRSGLEQLLRDHGIGRRQMKILIAQGVIEKKTPFQPGGYAYYSTSEILEKVIQPLASGKFGTIRHNPARKRKKSCMAG